MADQPDLLSTDDDLLLWTHNGPNERRQPAQEESQSSGEVEEIDDAENVAETKQDVITAYELGSNLYLYKLP